MVAPFGVENCVNEKLRVLVRVDLDGAKAHVNVQGHVTVQNVHGLYGVVQRAGSLTSSGMAGRGTSEACAFCTDGFPGLAPICVRVISVDAP